LPQSLPDGYYRIDLALTAFNGQRQIVERTVSETYYHLSSCSDNSFSIDKLGSALDKHNIFVDCSPDSISSGPQVDTGTFLLAAIDPTAENQLIHLDKSITGGRMLTSQDDVHRDDNPQLASVKACTTSQPSSCTVSVPNYAIPVLFHTQLPGQITLKGTFTRVAPATLDPQTVIAKGGSAYLTRLPGQQILFNGVIPLAQSDPALFSGTTFVLNGNSLQPKVSSNGADPFNSIDPFISALKFLYTPSGLTYQPAMSPDGQSNAAYTLVPEGVQQSEAAFRVLNSLHVAQRTTAWKGYTPPTAFYFFDAVGSFTGDTMTAQFSNPLNWLPENTYTSPPTVLRYDAQGKQITPTNLLPTTNTAGFVIQPPLALTTLNAAIRLRGDHIISAIRVRVSGVEAANPASWKRIQQVAGLIERQTHLRVLVTLGSSPRPTLVYVPGVKQGQFGATHNIDPVGWVEERWIAIVYLAQLGATRLLLLGAVLAVCLGYLIVAFSTLIAAQRKEFAVLSALGWRPWQPARLFLAQALLLALGGGIGGLGIALLITTLLDAIPIWLIVIWTLPAMLVMALLSSLYPLWQIWHIRPAEVLRAGSPVVGARFIALTSFLAFPLLSLVSPIASLVVRNLARSRPRTLITLASLFLSAILLVLMFSSILALRQTLMGTLLGDFVLLQTAVPQIAGCAFALLLSFLSVADLLLLQVRERQQEIGLLQAIGWRPGLVQWLFMQEGLVLALLGAIPGALLALGILVQQPHYPGIIQNSIPSPLVAFSTVLLMVCVAALAAIPALRAVNRMQVADVLRAE